MEKLINYCKNNKIKSIVLGVILLIIIVLSILFALKVIFKVDITNLGNKNKIVSNTNKNIIANKEIDGIKIDNIKVSTEDNSSKYQAKATNTTDKDIDIKGFILTFYENKNEIGTIKIYIDGIKSKDTVDLVNFSAMDFTKANKVEYETIY